MYLQLVCIFTLVVLIIIRFLPCLSWNLRIKNLDAQVCEEEVIVLYRRMRDGYRA